MRCAAGGASTDFYLATRHYFCWYASNVLRLTPEDAAVQLVHRDGGKLVRTLYGHFGGASARERIREAFEHVPELPISLRATGQLRATPRARVALTGEVCSDARPHVKASALSVRVDVGTSR